MVISSALDYAYRASLILARKYDDGGPVTTAQIAAAEGLSEGFLLQVLAILRRAGIVHSIRGKNGGYRLAKAPSQVTLADICGAMETSRPRSDCPMRPDAKCCRNDPTCHLVHALSEASRAAEVRLAAFDLETLSQTADVEAQAVLYAS